MNNIAFIGLGSNLGRREDNLAAALRLVEEFEDTTTIAVSQGYETVPAGPDAAEHPLYANAVARLRTGLRADQLLAKLLSAEEELGRPPAAERAGAATAPRVIDLDLLLFGEEEWHSEDLVLPHPRMRGREFVMRPLVEVAPDATWPDGSLVSASDLAEASGGRIIAALGPIPGFEEITAIPDEELAPGGWVEFAMLSRMRPDIKPDLDLLFVQSILEDAGIPVVWDPHPPAQGINPWGISATLKMYVPSSYAERAARLIAEAESAEIEWPEFADDDNDSQGTTD
jgi:2-amino-4-hydroxy-6-hydroxymethyldihydropteridine diphosphokinase